MTQSRTCQWSWSLLAAASLAVSSVLGADQAAATKAVEARVELLLGRMTLEEKLAFVGGFENFYVRPIERLGVPRIVLADGPLGVRNYGKATAFPAPIMLAATWNPELSRAVGAAMGRESRAKGVHVLLAPGVNIHRSPLCSRNFEYWGEDPYLGRRMVVPFVEGVQGEGVVATVKHFAGNNQEYDRMTVSSNIDERTLHEIYLPIFRAAVTEARVGAVMTAYNLLNGENCSESHTLLTKILKGDWGFDGVVMSDWGAVRDGVKAAAAGLDLEMPTARQMSPSALRAGLESGQLKLEQLDDKVQRILRLIVRNGFMDRPQRVDSLSLASAESTRAARDAASEGIVLLKNEGRALPIEGAALESFAVIGPTAHPATPGGGGSSTVVPHRAISVLEGLMQRAGQHTKVVYDPGIEPVLTVPERSCAEAEIPASFRAEYFAGRYLEGTPALVREDPEVRFHWKGAPGAGVPSTLFSVRWTGVLRVKVSGPYHLLVRGDDVFRLLLNHRLLLSSDEDEATARVAPTYLEAGRDYHLRLEYHQNRDDAQIAFAVTRPRVVVRPLATLVARKAAAAVVCVGFDAESETEGVDRTFELPTAQVELIKAIADVNPRTIVVLTAGGNVAMAEWVDRVSALLHGFYPGQEGGAAIADVILGRQSPSGKLPVSFERRLEDNPSYPSYHDRDGDKQIAYEEGVFVGYRHYDARAIEPRFPFGFGLSYTTFQLDDLALSTTTLGPAGTLRISCRVTNTGSRRGAEVVQLYLGEQTPAAHNPLRELKGFSKVWLDPGQTTTVRFTVEANDLAHYNAALHQWRTAPRGYRALVGTSSRDLRLQAPFTVTSPAS